MARTRAECFPDVSLWRGRRDFFCSTHSCGMLPACWGSTATEIIASVPRTRAECFIQQRRPAKDAGPSVPRTRAECFSSLSSLPRLHPSFCSTHSCGMLPGGRSGAGRTGPPSVPRTRAECFCCWQGGTSGCWRLLFHALVRNASSVKYLVGPHRCIFCSTHSCGMLRQDPTISWLREDDAEAVCTNAWSHIIPARGSPSRNGAQDSDDMSVRRCEHPRRPAGAQGSHSSVGTDLPPIFSFPCFVLFVSFDVYGVCRFFVQAALAL